MPEEHCFVCASNDGIFLDIFGDGKHYRESVEKCLSMKIQKKKIPSSKICHKCVYELDQCSKFVTRYKKTCRVEKGKLYEKHGYCSLCMQPGKNGYIFDLENNPMDNSIEKLRELFQMDFTNENSCRLSICLDCRYNLDVLLDLNGLYKDTSRCLKDILNGDMKSSKCPKVRTCVVRRRTTLTRMSSLSLSRSSLDTNASTVILEPQTHVSATDSKKLSSYERKCDECNIKIENGMDMYRLHNTGDTVCKECWMTMDPYNETKKNTRKCNNIKTETKLCSVFLKDILSTSLETKKKDDIKIEKTEKSTDSEIVYIISSDETETTPPRSMRTKRKKQMTENVPIKKLKKTRSRIRSNSVQKTNVTNKSKITRQSVSESGEKSESDNKNLQNGSKTAVKLLASTSKSTEEKKTRELRPRLVTTQKRMRDQSMSSLSSSENDTSSKVQRTSSPSYEIVSFESKTESDSDNSRPYKCKFCSSDFENKIVGLTHELTHSKKLEVVLEKVTLPDTTEDNKIFERDMSTEFDSPSTSFTEQTAMNNTHIVPSDESIRELSDLSQDELDKDELNSNTKIPIITKDDESKGEKEEEGKKKEEEDTESREEISANQSTLDNELDDTVIDTRTYVDTNKTGKEVDDIVEDNVNDKIPSTEAESVVKNIEIDNVREQPTETTKLGVDDEVEKSDGKECSETNHIEETEEQISKVDQSNEKIIDEIVSEKNGDLESEETGEKIESLEKNECETIKESEKDTVSQNEVVVNGKEELTDIKNTDDEKSIEEKIENDTKDSDEENKNDDEKEEKAIEEENEDNLKNSIVNINIGRELPDTTTTENDDHEIDTAKTTECVETSDKSEKCFDVDADKIEEVVNNSAIDKIANEIPCTDIDIPVKNTEMDSAVDDIENKVESTGNDEKLVDITEKSEAEIPVAIHECGEMKNAGKIPFLESTPDNKDCDL